MHGLGLIISMFVELSQPFHSLQWTDDTSMALCLAESLIECQGFNPADQASRYWRWYQVSGHSRCPHQQRSQLSRVLRASHALTHSSLLLTQSGSLLLL